MKSLSSGNWNIIYEYKINESIERVISSKQYNYYCSPKGIKELRMKICELLNQLWEYDVNYNDMIITTGSQQSINLITDIFLKSNDSIVVEKPCYYGAIKIFKNKNFNISEVNIDEEGIDLKSLEEKVKRYNPKMIYVVPTFNNPTGYSWSNENRKKFLKIINKYNITVIEDDPYSMVNFTDEKYESLYKLNNGKNVIYLGTFSKLISPSVNVGYILVDNDLIKQLYELKENYDLCTSLFNQYVILDYLSNNDLEEDIKAKIPLYKEKANIMQDRLTSICGENIEFSKMKGGLFFRVKFKNNRIPKVLQDKLECFYERDMMYSRINICYEYQFKL